MAYGLELKTQERTALEHIERHGHCWPLRRRARAILLLAQGRTPTEVAAILQTRRESIYIWRRHWQDQGLDGLAEGRHTGRPGMLGEEQLRYLAELADQGAYAVPQLLALLQERWPEVAMQPASLRRVLRQQGFRWKRTRYSLKKKPQPAYQLAVEQLRRFQAATQRGEMDLAYFDGSGFSANPVLRYAWARIGEQKAVFRQRHTKRFNVLGCLLHGELAWQGLWGRLNGAAIAFFMNELVKRLRRRTVVILDNASMHHAKLLKRYQAQWQARGLKFYYLPAYSPELNRIEGMWKQVKYGWYPFVEATELELENRIAQILNEKGDAYAINLIH